MEGKKEKEGKNEGLETNVKRMTGGQLDCGTNKAYQVGGGRK
jgi:hypothetical protein